MASNGKRRDILYLVHRAPYPPDKGDRIRAYHILRFLAKRANVHLACLADEPVGIEVVKTLRSLCQEVAIVPLGKSRWLRAFGAFIRGRSITEGAFSSSALRSILRSWCEKIKFTAALASASSMAPYLQMKELKQIPAVIDLVDVDSQKWLDYSDLQSWPRSWLYHWEGRQLRRLEKTFPEWARAITLVSEAETDIYRRFALTGCVKSVTNGVDQGYFSAANGEPGASATGVCEPRASATGAVQTSCVFVGALDYYPNIDGVVWFCRNAWPQIHERHPNTTFSLVGRRPVPAVTALANIPGVEVVGEVPDVRPYLTQAAVTVIPLRIARGLQNKVTEALAMGNAVVASPPAVAALKIEPSVHLLTASSPDEWVDAVSRLLEDRALRQELGAAGRRYVEEHHHWDRCLNPFAALLGIAEISAIGS